MSTRRRRCYGMPAAALLMRQGNGGLGSVQILTAKLCAGCRTHFCGIALFDFRLSTLDCLRRAENFKSFWLGSYRAFFRLFWLGPRSEHGHHSWDVTTIHPSILARARLAMASRTAGKSWKGPGHSTGKGAVLISTARNPHESDPRVVSTKLCLIRSKGCSRY